RRPDVTRAADGRGRGRRGRSARDRRERETAVRRRRRRRRGRRRWRGLRALEHLQGAGPLERHDPEQQHEADDGDLLLLRLLRLLDLGGALARHGYGVVAGAAAGVVGAAVVVVAAGGAAVAAVAVPNTNAFSCSVARIDGNRFSLSPNVIVSTLNRRPS